MIRNPLSRKSKKSKVMASSIDETLKIKAEGKGYRSCKFIKWSMNFNCWTAKGQSKWQQGNNWKTWMACARCRWLFRSGATINEDGGKARQSPERPPRQILAKHYCYAFQHGIGICRAHAFFQGYYITLFFGNQEAFVFSNNTHPRNIKKEFLNVERLIVWYR